MEMDERARYELSEKLVELLGQAPAATLMASLPPSRWDDLATKPDLERFATKQDLERFATKQDLERLPTHQDLEAMEYRLMAAFRGELLTAITGQTRTMVLGLFGLVVTMGSFVLVAAGIS